MALLDYICWRARVQVYLAVLDEGTVGLEDDEATVHVLQQVELALQDHLHVG